MEFALFYEIPVPKPWTADSEHQAYKNVIEEAVLGEQAGFHSFWTVEHHFLDEYSHCSAPDALYGAIAAQTTTLRIGHGVRLLPKPYNHPIRAAEAAAVVDIISDGRLEFGTGRSSTRAELEGFGADPDLTRAQWEEGLRMVVGAWTESPFEWHGETWDVPPRDVHPKPLQQPHPPLWVATSSPPSHVLAGELGLGLLSFTIGVPPEELGERIKVYRDAQTRASSRTSAPRRSRWCTAPRPPSRRTRKPASRSSGTSAPRSGTSVRLRRGGRASRSEATTTQRC
jgi:alkanesulfonate monooxygenase SsuD/methylene tetrahydromethanopterin reductase-like flavin-dependent oxidoreductase (luciferase family)